MLAYLSQSNPEAVSPIFERNTAEILKCHSEGPVNLLPHLQRTVAEAMMTIIIGDECTSTRHFTLLRLTIM